jgi:branched-chain amino acid transport system permease protein
MMEAGLRSKFAGHAAFAAAMLALCALPWIGGKYAADLAVRVMIMSVFAMGLQLLVGRVGLVSLGQAAYFGIAAYAAALLSPADAPAGLAWLLPAALAPAAAYAALAGALSLRTRGIYFIMVTLAFAQLAFTVGHDTALVGGSDGVYINVRPMLSVTGHIMLDLERPAHRYGLAWSALLMTYLALSALGSTRFGHALDGIRQNEARMRASGCETGHLKLAAFVIAGVVSALAGFLHAIKDGYVNPDLLSWHQSGRVLLMVILGGAGSLGGAMAGAAGLTLMEELFQSETIFGPLARHWQLALGLAVIALVAALPRGLTAVFRAGASKGAGRDA